jgi:hypothetical protein
MANEGPLSFFLANAPAGSPLSYEALQSRRKIAEALLGRRSPFPKSIGEGLTYFGEKIADRRALDALDEQDKALMANRLQQTAGLALPGVTEGSGDGTVVPPVAPPRPASAAIPLPEEEPTESVLTPEQKLGDYGRRLIQQRAGYPGVITGPGGAERAQVPPIGVPGTGRIDAPGPVRLPAQPLPPAGEDPGNPPIITTDIKPAPPAPLQGGFGAAIPGPLDQVPGQAGAPQIGGRVSAPPASEHVMPTAPVKNEQLTPEEIRGERARMNNLRGDPVVDAAAQRLIQFGAAKREAAYQREVDAFKVQADIFKKNEELRQQYMLDAPKRETEQRERELKLYNDNQKMMELAKRGGVTPEQAYAVVKKSHEDTQSIPNEVNAVRDAQRLLPSMITGLGADAKVNALRLLDSLNIYSAPGIDANQQFQSYIKEVYGRLRPQVIGAGPQANAEGKVLERAAAGDVNMDPRAISAVLNSIYKLNIIAATEHQKKLATFTGNDPQGQQYVFNTFGLPMKDIIPPGAIQTFRQHYKEDPQAAIMELNKSFNTPGLAQSILAGQ